MQLCISMFICALVSFSDIVDSLVLSYFFYGIFALYSWIKCFAITLLLVLSFGPEYCVFCGLFHHKGFLNQISEIFLAKTIENRFSLMLILYHLFHWLRCKTCVHHHVKSSFKFFPFTVHQEVHLARQIHGQRSQFL